MNRPDESLPATSRFADKFEVGFNHFEFLLDFGIGSDSTTQFAAHTRIVTNPGAFKEFLDLAQGSLHTWRYSLLSPYELKQTQRTDVVLENLGYLDAVLQDAYVRAQKVFDREASGERRPWEYRGLHISKGETDRLLKQRPGSSPLSEAGDNSAELSLFDRNPIWGEFGERFQLSAFDQAVTVLALAPEVDVRYEKLYSYLQDDVTRKWPTVNLALDLLAPHPQSKLSWRARFGSNSPLVSNGLLRIVPDPARADSSTLDRLLRLDPQAISYLLADGVDEDTFGAAARVFEPAITGRFDRPDIEAVASIVRESYESNTPLLINFYGPQGARQSEAAESMASATGARLLAMDADAAFGQEPPSATITAMFRFAVLHRAVLYLDRADVLDSETYRASFRRALAQHPGITITSTAKPWTGQATKISFLYPDFAARRAAWHGHIRRVDLPETQQVLDELAGRFILTQSQIASAMFDASLRIRLLIAERPDQALSPAAVERELLASARAQAGQDLGELARKVEPTYTWKDIVLTPEIETQLREISARATLRYKVLDEWGFRKTLAQATGISALFTGPSGAGKTMAAEVLASELSVDLYKIDLSTVVSKFIGVTEQNLEKIFTAAERSNAILFFDEADALFGKRSEVQDAHDRYANIEISYLLQRMEHFEGIAILATNLRGNLDDAFLRRLDYTVRFALPAAPERIKIWNQIWPSKDLLDPDVDLNRLGEKFQLSGGNIRNIVLAASFFAAERESQVTQDDILRGIQREYDKLGKTMTTADLRAALGSGKAA